jgi:hypothetical protein
MKRYFVSIPYSCWVTVEVEACNEDDAIEAAIEAAFDDGAVERLCGNGENVSIDVDDESIDGIADFKIEIDELY